MRGRDGVRCHIGTGSLGTLAAPTVQIVFVEPGRPTGSALIVVRLAFPLVGSNLNL
jgi:hypothetical protein